MFINIEIKINGSNMFKKNVKLFLFCIFLKIKFMFVLLIFISFLKNEFSVVKIVKLIVVFIINNMINIWINIIINVFLKFIFLWLKLNKNVINSVNVIFVIVNKIFMYYYL